MKKLILSLSAVAVVAAFASIYVVDQRQKAILFRLGEIVKSDLKPGLHFKVPLINNVRKFDSRILTLNARPESFLTIEKKNVTVDFFVKWRIQNVAQYYRATRGEERNAQSRLSQIMKDGLRNEFGRRTIRQLVSGDRNEIMDNLQIKANMLARELGIQIVDIRVSRIDLPDDVSGSVYDRMRAERNRVARDFRARGQEQAERLRAEADRKYTEITADAYRQAEQIRGEGDAQAAKIYADAYESDPEFYSFFRSINAYVNSFSGKSDMLLLEPDSKFFRYFSDPKGQQ